MKLSVTAEFGGGGSLNSYELLDSLKPLLGPQPPFLNLVAFWLWPARN